jgi:hypothetical protein
MQHERSGMSALRRVPVSEWRTRASRISSLPFRDFRLRVIETDVEGSTKNQEAREYTAHSLLKKG